MRKPTAIHPSMNNTASYPSHLVPRTESPAPFALHQPPKEALVTSTVSPAAESTHESFGNAADIPSAFASHAVMRLLNPAALEETVHLPAHLKIRETLALEGRAIIIEGLTFDTTAEHTILNCFGFHDFPPISEIPVKLQLINNLILTTGRFVELSDLATKVNTLTRNIQIGLTEDYSGLWIEADETKLTAIYDGLRELITESYTNSFSRLSPPQQRFAWEAHTQLLRAFNILESQAHLYLSAFNQAIRVKIKSNEVSSSTVASRPGKSSGEAPKTSAAPTTPAKITHDKKPINTSFDIHFIAQRATITHLSSDEINALARQKRLEKLPKMGSITDFPLSPKIATSRDNQLTLFAEDIIIDRQTLILTNIAIPKSLHNEISINALSCLGFYDFDEDGDLVLLQHLDYIIFNLNESYECELPSPTDNEALIDLLYLACPFQLDDEIARSGLMQYTFKLPINKWRIQSFYHLLREYLRECRSATYKKLSESIKIPTTSKEMTSSQNVTGLNKAYDLLFTTLDEYEAAALNYLTLFKRLATEAESADESTTTPTP